MDARRISNFYEKLKNHDVVRVSFKDNDPSKGFELLVLGETSYKFDHVMTQDRARGIYVDLDEVMRDEEEKEPWEGNEEAWKNEQFKDLPKRSYAGQLITLSDVLKTLVEVVCVDGLGRYVSKSISVHFRDEPSDIERVEIDSKLEELSKRNSKRAEGRLPHSQVSGYSTEDFLK